MCHNFKGGVTTTLSKFGCDASQGRAMFDRLGGTLIVRHEGHFVSETLPFLDRLIV